MQLILHIDTKGVPAAILDAAYAFFPPYKFTDGGNGILNTTIDASHDLTDEQYGVVATLPTTVSLVLPANLQVTPITATAPSTTPTAPTTTTSNQGG